MFKYLPCTSWNTAKLYDILLSSFKCLICYMGNTYFFISIISITLLFVSFFQITLIQVLISIISITISIISNISFSHSNHTHK